MKNRFSYPFHGYWAKMDGFRLTLEQKQANLVKKHTHGIRIVLDGVINHTGPVTETDVAWPITGYAPVLF
jgi:alpha-amylase